MRTKLKLIAPSIIEAELQINATIGEFKEFLKAVERVTSAANMRPYEFNKFVEPIQEAVNKVEKEIHIWHEPTRESVNEN
jgi:hypothetical protein